MNEQASICDTCSNKGVGCGRSGMCPLLASNKTMARILAKKEVGPLVDPLLTDAERDVVFDAISELKGE